MIFCLRCLNTITKTKLLFQLFWSIAMEQWSEMLSLIQSFYSINHQKIYLASLRYSASFGYSAVKWQNLQIIFMIFYFGTLKLLIADRWGILSCLHCLRHCCCWLKVLKCRIFSKIRYCFSLILKSNYFN